MAPNTRTIRTLLIVLAIFTAIGGLMTFVVVASGRAWTMAATRALATSLTVFLCGGLFFIFLWLWSANVRLLIGQGAVGYRNIFRRSHFWYRGEIDRAVDMAVSYGWTTQQPQRAIYLFGLDGRRLLVLTSRAWKAQDLKDFIDATGVLLDYRDAPVKAKDARGEFPRAFGWAAQHVLMLTLITMAAAISLGIGAFALLSALFRK